jgi:hypothetical protein
VLEYFAFKIVDQEFVGDFEQEAGRNCDEVAHHIATEIFHECQRIGHPPVFKDEDIVSLAEAQRSTSVLKRMDYALKRFLYL